MDLLAIKKNLLIRRLVRMYSAVVEALTYLFTFPLRQIFLFMHLFKNYSISKILRCFISLESINLIHFYCKIRR